MQVPRTQTPLSEVELAVALRDGHELARGLPASRLRLGCAWAQVALENAHGKATYQYCLGNVTAGGGWEGDYFVLHVDERIKKKERDGVDEWKAIDLKFRSYGGQRAPSIERAIYGAAGYWALFSGRYKSVLALFDAGQPAEAAFELGRLNYFTAKPWPYASAMASLVTYYERVVEPHVPERTLPDAAVGGPCPFDEHGEGCSMVDDASIAAEIAMFEAQFPEFVRRVDDDEAAEWRKTRGWDPH